MIEGLRRKATGAVSSPLFLLTLIVSGGTDDAGCSYDMVGESEATGRTRVRMVVPGCSGVVRRREPREAGGVASGGSVLRIREAIYLLELVRQELYTTSSLGISMPRLEGWSTEVENEDGLPL